MAQFSKRGRSSNRRRQGGNNNPNRSMDSQGPEVKIRGTASQIYEKYQALGRDCISSGDRIRGESLMQHAEHYYRLMKSVQPDKRDEKAGDDQDSSDHQYDSRQNDDDESFNQSDDGDNNAKTSPDDSTASDKNADASTDGTDEDAKPRRRRRRRRPDDADASSEDKSSEEKPDKEKSGKEKSRTPRLEEAPAE